MASGQEKHRTFLFWLGFAVFVAGMLWLYIAAGFMALMATWHCQKPCDGSPSSAEPSASSSFGASQAIDKLWELVPFSITFFLIATALLLLCWWLAGWAGHRRGWFRLLAVTIALSVLSWTINFIVVVPRCSCNRADTVWADPIWYASWIVFLASAGFFIILATLAGWTARGRTASGKENAAP